jgi:7-cyano-7-deazaguanine synthase
MTNLKLWVARFGDTSKPAIVLLSGGMDSTVALYWAKATFPSVRALFVDYGQISVNTEWKCTQNIARLADTDVFFARFPVFISPSSIIGVTPIAHYANVQEAMDDTANDPSYVPLRNAVFTTVAAHHLLVRSPKGGSVVLGVRSRADGDTEYAGFPDCSTQFCTRIGQALSIAANAVVDVLDPLNHFAPTRGKTVQMAREVGAFEALRFTHSCFHAKRCGKCLPCLRRAQAFAEVGLDDPAM